jgi:Arc/MetJ-type ribon-helix-helix transcriptional regulator
MVLSHVAERIACVHSVTFDSATSQLGQVVESGSMYGLVMQIAVVIPDETVDDIDQLVPSQFRSRAEVVRHAVDFWLAARRSADIDRRYTEAFDKADQSVDQIDAVRVETHREPASWADLEW